MLIQTKRAIDTLKAAGLKRDSFRVRTPLDRKVMAYTTTKITVYGKIDPAIVDIKMIVDAGYNVTQTVGFREDRTRTIIDIMDCYNRRAKFQVLDFHDEVDEYGFHWPKTYYFGKPQWEKRI